MIFSLLICFSFMPLIYSAVVQDPEIRSITLQEQDKAPPKKNLITYQAPTEKRIRRLLIPTEIEFYMRDDVKAIILKWYKNASQNKVDNIDDSFIRILFTCFKIYFESQSSNLIYIDVNILEQNTPECIVQYEVIDAIMRFFMEIRAKFEARGYQITYNQMIYYTGHYLS